MCNVKWGEYKLGELFKIENTLSFNSDALTDGGEYDYVTRTSKNQGVLQTTGFVNARNLNNEGTWSLGLLQMDFFYRKRRWYAGQFVRKITPKIKIPSKAVLYFTTILNKQKPKLLSVLVRNVDEVFRETVIELPMKENGEIDFDFMEALSKKIGMEQMVRLEIAQAVGQAAYKKASGQMTTKLSAEEKNSLNELENQRWKMFRVGDLFERVKTNKLPYKVEKLPNKPIKDYRLPCLTSSFKNQGLNYFVPSSGATILKNVISIPSNSDVYRAYYQPFEFTVLSDAYAIQWNMDERVLLPEQYLFFVSSINKVTDLPIYSYKNKLGGWNVVKDKWIQLPVEGEQINYELMKQVISALQKLVIQEKDALMSRKVREIHEIVENEL